MGPPPHGPQGDPLTTVLAAAESEELVARARTGDRAAFDQLVRATQADAFALALRLTGDEDDAHDAVQDAYLRAFRSIRRFRGDAAFSTWLHRITANCSKTLLSLRRRASHQDLDALSGAEDESALADREPDHDPEARSCRGVELDRLARALATLPSGLRAVVVLRDVHDLTHEAIARRLGISLSAAKVRLHRARRRLRDELHGETAEDDGAGATGAGAGEAIVRAG